MLDQKFRKVIELIAERLNKEGIGWMLTGSSNMAFQGINIAPRDLDVFVRFDDLDKARALFADYDVSKIRELKPLIDRPAWEVVFEIDGINVQVLGEKDDGEYITDLLEGKTVEIEGVRCFDLATEAEVYTKTGREERAKTIRDFLEKA
ncbi:MAG: hypothetical protein KKD18_04960 [Nanoarchaeota archaeon]|nr:hypothetical protein [Nanoarchaeota archaeon]MBU0977741.1 hypothetical protein [Nanoarchaeota archaeon]